MYLSTLRGPGPVEAGDVGGLLSGVLADGRVRIPPGTAALLYGPRGIGKTSLALSMFSRPWVCTTEMDPGLVRRYARRLGVVLAGVSVPERLEDPETGETWWDLGVPLWGEGAELDAEDVEIGGVVLDSNAPDPWGLWGGMVQLLEAGQRGVTVSQVTKEGKAQGTERIPHDHHAVIRMEPGDGYRRIVVEKHRFGELGTYLYALGAGGTQLPEWDHFYSIEGTGPSYRLQPYPFGRARFADYLNDCEKMDDAGGDLRALLGPPPAAVACKRSSLYPGGYVEPPDVESRRRFAESHGVRFYTPGAPREPRPQGD